MAQLDIPYKLDTTQYHYMNVNNVHIVTPIVPISHIPLHECPLIMPTIKFQHNVHLSLVLQSSPHHNLYQVFHPILHVLMRMHETCHSLLWMQLKVMGQVNCIEVPTSFLWVKFHLHMPFATNSHRTLLHLFIYTTTIVVTFLVTEKPLHLWALPALLHIKSCHFGIVAIVVICIIEVIKFHVLLWNELFMHQWTLNHYNKKINMISTSICSKTTRREPTCLHEYSFQLGESQRLLV
jgi:hypothetical protein